jgi:hypothetical protein
MKTLSRTKNCKGKIWDWRCTTRTCSAVGSFNAEDEFITHVDHNHNPDAINDEIKTT